MFKLIITAILLGSFYASAEVTKNDDLKKQFDTTKVKALALTFTSANDRKTFLEELKNLQKIYDQAKENAIKEEKPDFTPTAISKITTTMAVDLSFLEQLEGPVKTRFNRETCVNALASNSASIESNAGLSKKISDILSANCKIN